MEDGEMRPNKRYLVLDLEATCDQPESFPRSECEIIEIGAVLVDSALRPGRSFQTFVRPQLHPELTAFCTELTTIEQAQVDDAPEFPDAIEALARFIEGEQVLLASWGAYDKNQLRRDAELHGVRLPYGTGHLNIKAEFAEKAGRRMGVGGALRRVGLTFEGTPHRGIDDARNIARLMPWALGLRPLPRR
jgi:inhibitor of KinA sporulation pathway (predicted exonuclease)